MTAIIKNIIPDIKNGVINIFYLPHRRETRGIGGIFFDYKMDNWDKDFLFVKDVGLTFSYLVKKIIKKKMFLRSTQKRKRISIIKKREIC